MTDHTPSPFQPQLPFDEVHFITLSRKAIDITGQRFGRLVALGPVGGDRRGSIIWHCRCDCGETTRARFKDMRIGNTNSCGCLRRDRTSAAFKIHGQAGNRIYKVWRGIVRRCTYPQDISYANYGGRGITLCDEWRHDFQAFYDHVSKLPNYGKKSYQIDRIDNEGCYQPGNVRWSSRTQQSRNKRNVHEINYNGKTQCLADWADEVGIKAPVLWKRLRRGWSIEKTMTTPLRPY